MPSSPLPPVTLVLGGARSGKSAYAETMIGERPALYLATAQIFDNEMAERIRLHQLRRGDQWETLEEPFNLVQALLKNTRPDRPILIDCLTLWLSNILLAGQDIKIETALLINALRKLQGPVILVANEVGLGIVSENALARAFRDHAGIINQSVASVANQVVFVAAGLPLILKGQYPDEH